MFEKHWVQDEQVLRYLVFFWALADGYFGCQKIEQIFPWDFELSGNEIKYLWIARMIMLSLWFKDKIPFKKHFSMA